MSGFELPAGLIKGIELGVGVLGAAAAVSSATGQRAASELSAELARRQADRERRIAERDAEEFQRRNRRLLARSRALQGATGLAAAGTPLLVDEQMARDIERGVDSILSGGQARADALEGRARLDLLQGRSALRTGLLDAGRTLLTGLGRTER